MPDRPARPCTHIGCAALSRDGTGRCSNHPRETWVKSKDAPKRITGRKLQKLRKDLFAQSSVCAICAASGRTTLATQRDHIEPLSKTRTDRPDNYGMQALCKECHDSKSKSERSL